MATSKNKKKGTARENAMGKIAGRPGTGGKAKVPPGNAGISKSRFPGETPLAGEDRPKTRPGSKKQGQRTATAPQGRTVTVKKGALPKGGSKTATSSERTQKK